MTPYARRATPEDAYYLAPRLRADDQRELEAAGSESPLSSLLTGLASPDGAWVGEGKGGPFCIFGTVPSPEQEVGFVWLLATDGIKDNQISFLRQSISWVSLFHSQYPILCNHADARNTLHIRWLRWLGFTFINQRPIGKNGEVFLEFARLHV